MTFIWFKITGFLQVMRSPIRAFWCVGWFCENPIIWNQAFGPKTIIVRKIFNKFEHFEIFSVIKMTQFHTFCTNIPCKYIEYILIPRVFLQNFQEKLKNCLQIYSMQIRLDDSKNSIYTVYYSIYHGKLHRRIMCHTCL